CRGVHAGAAPQPRRVRAGHGLECEHRAGGARLYADAGARDRPAARDQRMAAEDRCRHGTGLTMRAYLLQVAAVTLINVRSIPHRFWLSLSTVVAIALVVTVLLSFLAMAYGFQRTLAGTGATDVAIVLRGGSRAEINSTVSRDQGGLIEDGPGIAREAGGKPLGRAWRELLVEGGNGES